MSDVQLSVPLLPWKGASYASGFRNGLKLLVLGESQYVPSGKPWPDHPESYTREVVKDFIKLGDRKSYTMDFAGKLHRILTGKPEPSEDEVKGAWSRVAYVNYIPEIVGYGAAASKDLKHWERGHRRLPELLDGLKPDRVLVLGRTNWLRIRYGRWSLDHGESIVGGKRRGFWEFDIGKKVALSSWIYHPSRNMDPVKNACNVLNDLFKVGGMR